MKKYVMNSVIISAVILVFAFSIAPSAFSMTPEEIKLLGHTENGIYVNATLGIEADFSGKNWRIMPEEDVIAFVNMKNVISDDTSAMDKAVKYHIPVLQTITKDGSVNINLTVSSLGGMGGFAAMYPEEFMSGFLGGMALRIKKSHVESGMQDVNINVVKMEFLGEEHSGLYSAMKYKGIPMYQRTAAIVSGNYAYVINVTSVADDKTLENLKIFRKTESK